MAAVAEQLPAATAGRWRQPVAVTGFRGAYGWLKPAYFCCGSGVFCAP